MDTQMKRKFYTVEEANQTLPLVRAIVSDIVTLYRDVHERRERLTRMRQIPGSENQDQGNVYSEEVGEIEKELEKDILRLESYVEELTELGVVLKDPLAGLIDFWTVIDGREAYLCWKSGEEEIGFWHEIDAGFQGRQSLLERAAPRNESSEEL
jgi:hypothetical protein